MVNKFFHSILACAFFVAAANAQDVNGTSTDAPAFTPTYKVACHNVSDVPMTVDPEQALPLKLVANLPCGEQVALLSSADGYTVKVQIADGRTGFIAGLFLKKLPAPLPRLDAANLKNGVARWVDGAPGCDHFMSSDGSWVESITLNGITVQASLYDTGWKLRAQVAVANDSPAPISVDPAKFVLDEIGEFGKPLRYQDPTELAKNMTHQVLWTEATAGPVTVPVRADSSASVNTFGATYKIAIRTNPGAPNYLLSHQDAENEAIRMQGTKTVVNYAKQVQNLALKAGTVAPNGSVAGAVWFERSSKPDQVILRVPVDSMSFEFRLAFRKHR